MRRDSLVTIVGKTLAGRWEDTRCLCCGTNVPPLAAGFGIDINNPEMAKFNGTIAVKLCDKCRDRLAIALVPKEGAK